MKKVVVLYDFDGQPETAELSIRAGETLTVTSESIGEGWWEGVNERNISGIFPAAYVEEASAAQPPPPPPAKDYTLVSGNSHAEPSFPDSAKRYSNCWQSPVLVADDWDDDEWDDDASEIGGVVSSSQATEIHGIHPRSNRSSSTGDISQFSGKMDGKSTVRRNFNPFSSFAKTGGEAYLLGDTKGGQITDAQKVLIVEAGSLILWAANPFPYTVAVASPKKESKLKGLKTFIAYQLTPSFNNVQVSRRYKHFDWLRERLEEKFCLISSPPLPDKQVSGRYEEQFIEKRRTQLQSFVDRVSRHPVLSRCETWQHFVTCTDDKKWKVGKRRAEKDEYVGANFFLTIQVPDHPLDPLVIEANTEAFSRYVQVFDNALKDVQMTGSEQMKRCQSTYRREFQRIGTVFRALEIPSDYDEHSEDSKQLRTALKRTGETYEEIGQLYSDQPKYDWEVIDNLMHDYRGIVSSFPSILAIHKGAQQKRKEVERMGAAPDLRYSVGQKSDVVSYATCAEINHFHSERCIDFRKSMKLFLTEQIAFYQKIVDRLQQNLADYGDI